MIEYIKIPTYILKSMYFMEEGKPMETSEERLKRTNLKKWYMETFPTDDMGHELADITMLDVLDAMLEGKDVYDVIKAQDSLVRERVFRKLSELTGQSYAIIYNLWMTKA